MRSIRMSAYARLALVIVVGVCIAAIGVWALGAGSAPTEASASTPSVSLVSPISPVCDPNWNVVPSPNVGNNNNVLSGVAAISSSDVWAVGDYNNGTADQTLVEQWNGTQWSVVPSPSPGGDGNNNLLNGVAALSVSDVWAVGDYNNGTADQTLVEQWDGTQWSVVPSPSMVDWANDLYGVAAVSASDVWAVGNYNNSTVPPGGYVLVEHWDGTQWSVVNSADPGPDGDNILWGVAAVSASDVWAVGEYETDPGSVGLTLVEHWNGTQWSVVPSPNVGNDFNFLLGVAAVSASDVSAVGSYHNGTADQTLVEHWNGTQWSMVPSPNPGGDGNNNDLYGVAALSASDVWAVGSYNNGTADQTLVERYNPCTPTATPLPTQTPGGPTATPGAPTATPTVCALQFTDVPQGSTFYPYIRCLACRGIINGYHDGTFKPNNQVTRGQLSKIISNSAGFNDAQPNQMFEDVPVGSTFQVHIGRLASRGYINGYPCGGVGEPCVPPGNLPYFRPGNNATRGQISKIDANAAGFSDPPVGQQFEDVAVGSTFYIYTFRLVSRNVMGGYPCGGAGEPCVPPGNLPYFRPNNSATRGQTSKIVANTFFPDCQTPALKQ